MKNIRTLQERLTAAGFDAGKADGIWGPATAAAAHAAARAGRLAVTAAAAPLTPAAAAQVITGTPRIDSPSYADISKVYGPAGGALASSGRAILPFAFPLSWDDSQRVTQFACHVHVAKALTSIYRQAAAHYGEDTFRRLRLDRFGGCFNHRPMRGGTALSTHSWGVAVDHDPVRNQLKWGRDRAAFARPEYDAWWAIVEAHGAVSLGRAKNYDWMHFQFVKP